jgi:hypothetical protein
MSDRGRPLESYSSRVLAEWVRVRGWSYFPEELEAIEKRVEMQEQPVSPTNPDCSEGGSRKSGERTSACRYCGCTPSNPCRSADGAGRCFRFSPRYDFCSACIEVAGGKITVPDEVNQP